MKKFLLAMFVLAPLVVGCASTKPVTVRTHLPPPGTAGVAPTTSVVDTQQQYRSAPAPEEDPLVIQARAIGRQAVIDRERWKVACFELRKADMHATYETCRDILGDERYIGGYGYGRSVGGSVIGNSGGRVRWK